MQAIGRVCGTISTDALTPVIREVGVERCLGTRQSM